MTVRVLASIAVLALVVTACGDDDTEAGGENSTQDGSAGAESTTTEPVALSGEPVKLMLIGSLSGGLGLPEIEDAATAAVEAVNGSGGVDGRPIELLVCDDESDPNKAGECGRSAVKEGVVAVVGASTGFGSEYMAPLADAGIPSVGNIARGPAEITSPLSYPLGGGIAVALAGIGFAAGDAGGEVVHAAIPATGNATALAAPFINLGLAPFGLSVANTTPFAPETADVTPLVQATLEGGTDTVAFLMTPDLINKYLLALPNIGADPTLVSSTLVYSQDNFEVVGDAADGLLLVGQILPATTTDNAGVKRFNDEMDAIDSNAARSELAMNTWAAYHVVAELMRDMATIDSDSLIEAMESAGEIAFDPLPPFDWSTPIDGYPPASRVFSDSVVISEIRDGEIVALTGRYEDLGA